VSRGSAGSTGLGAHEDRPQGQLDDAFLKDGPFLRFLTSLGLQYENGQEKPAFEALREELKRPRTAQEPRTEGPPPPAVRDTAIEGVWRVLSAEFSGTDFGPLRGAKLVLDAGKKTFVLPDGTVEKGSYEVGVGEPLRRIDATTEGRAGTALGIYAVEGKTLKMCFSQSGAGVASGVDFGEAGKRAVRVSYASSEDHTREAARRLGEPHFVKR